VIFLPAIERQWQSHFFACGKNLNAAVQSRCVHHNKVQLLH
jgi:hypothetical protein